MSWLPSCETCDHSPCICHVRTFGLQDAYLPQRLVDKLMYMYNYIEMARVTGVPMSFLLTKGQSIKVFSQLLRKAKQRNLVIPFARVTPLVLPLALSTQS